MKIRILSWLLHHANRKYHNPEFYAIKNRILKYHSQHICYDIQFIGGKKCYSCGGTGIHVYYSEYTGKPYDQDICWNCYNGWYKHPVWNILARVQFGKYTFHQPWQRVYVRPNKDWGSLIEGYIDHNESKYSDFAATILFLLYEKGYLKRWYKSAGMGFALHWWLPRNWLNNAIHLIKHGPKIPLSRLKRRFEDIPIQNYNTCYESDNLPF
jgi:hypothetical protein